MPSSTMPLPDRSRHLPLSPSSQWLGRVSRLCCSCWVQRLRAASGAEVVTGGVIGLAIAAALGYLFYLGSERVDLRKFFNWTGLLLILFAAGLFAKGIHEFREFFELEAAWYSASVWEISSGPLAEGWTYDFLKGLLGWSSDPERIRVAAYLVYLVPVLWFYFKGAVNPARERTTSTVPADAEKATAAV